MSAHADDLRYFYAETLGDTQLILAIAGASVPSVALEPGRYLVQFQDVAGAAKCWLRQGKETPVAAAAVPSTPFDLAEDPRPSFTFMVRGSGKQFLAAITDAGTCTVVVTKISREKH